MLNHIHMRNVKIVNPITNRNISKVMTEYSADMDFNAHSQGSYLMSGDYSYLFIRPQRKTTVTDLGSLQAFSIHEETERGYTDRSQTGLYEILYTLDGSGVLEYEGRKYTMVPGEGVFINGDHHHYYHAGEKIWKYSSLVLSGKIVEEMYNVYVKDHNCKIPQNSEVFYQSDLEELLRVYQSGGEFCDIYVMNAITTLLSHLLENKTKKNDTDSDSTETIRLLELYINQHYSENFSLDFLAEFSGISKYHLSREFHRFTGFSPCNYINMLRIKQAKFLLLNTRMTVKEISNEIGFSDANYFNHLFKKKTGSTPGGYRKHKLTDNM